MQPSVAGPIPLENPSTSPAEKIVLDFFFFFADDRAMGLLTDFLKTNEKLCITDERLFLSEHETEHCDVSGFRVVTAEQAESRVTRIYVTPAGERWLEAWRAHEKARVLLERQGVDLDREIKLWSGWSSKQAQTAEDLGPEAKRSHKPKIEAKAPGGKKKFAWKAL